MDTFIDVLSNTLEIKIKALQAYHEEMREWPHPPSHENVEMLANSRGAVVGKKAAEGFMLMGYQLMTGQFSPLLSRSKHENDYAARLQEACVSI